MESGNVYHFTDNFFINSKGELIGNNGLDEINLSDDYVIMQSTGLTDINGKEIFEGDIIIYNRPEMEGFLYQVKYDDFNLCYNLKSIVKSTLCCSESNALLNDIINGTLAAKISLRGEIKGNIYQNKELLGE